MSYLQLSAVVRFASAIISLSGHAGVDWRLLTLKVGCLRSRLEFTIMSQARPPRLPPLDPLAYISQVAQPSIHYDLLWPAYSKGGKTIGQVEEKDSRPPVRSGKAFFRSRRMVP